MFKRILAALLLLSAAPLCLAGCGGTSAEEAPISPAPAVEGGETITVNGETEEMKLYINSTYVPVSWENNAAVSEMTAQCAKSDITVSMSMYGGWEQVGPLGRSYTKSDSRITAQNGDIVLYSGNQIVVFYGENSWSYTMLGHMQLTADEVTALLSSGDVNLRLSNK